MTQMVETLIFKPLDKSLARTLWPEMAAFVADEPWMTWNEEHYLSDLPRKWELSFLIYTGETLIGYAICSQRGKLLWLHRFAIAATHRSKGVGAQAAGHLTVAAEANGLKGVVLKTPTANLKAVAFYERNGFGRMPDAGDFTIFRKMLPGHVFTVGIHQPNYIPWLGYFYKISLSDAFVFLDDVQFPKGSYVNRGRLNINGEARWLTIPANKSLDLMINEVFPSEPKWAEKHIRTLETTYRRAPHFKAYFGELSEHLLAPSHRNLAELNSSLVKLVCSWLGIGCLFYSSAPFATAKTSDDRLVEILQALGGEVYISGSGGANYQTQQTFDDAGIRLTYSNFKVEPYRQLSPEFVPGLSILDALFNIGADGVKEILERQAAMREAPAS